MNKVFIEQSKDEYTNKQLINVFKDTVSRIKNNMQLLSYKTILWNTKTYKQRNVYETQFIVSNRDTIQATINIDKNENVVLLNFANASSIGGGVLYGAIAQEEDICRCSTLYKSLIDVSSKYPINGHVLYTDNVYIFKDSKYDLLTNPVKCSVITAAAICFNTKIEKYEQHHKQDMIDLIDKILNCAYVNGHKYLVLGAFGCGAFGNPAKEVANIFYDLLMDKYKNMFEYVEFAIKTTDQNSENYVTFANQFEKMKRK